MICCGPMPRILVYITKPAKEVGVAIIIIKEQSITCTLCLHRVLTTGNIPCTCKLGQTVVSEHNKTFDTVTIALGKNCVILWNLSKHFTQSYLANAVYEVRADKYKSS